jgi:DNA helicase II / ATP-dependent DNA helicase PcrA
MVKAATLDEGIRELLDRTALSRSDGAGVDLDRVSLLTFHATKGLEFSRVYVAGVEDGQLPGRYAQDDGRADEVHEARRLLYVAMTRAKDRLILTYCKERNGDSAGGTAFLDDMGLTPASTPAKSGQPIPS